MKKDLKKDGFTLIELMVVMAIIAVLATLIIGAITLARRSARDTQRRANMKNIQVGLEAKFAGSNTNPKSYPAGLSTTVAAINTAAGVTITDPTGDERYCYYAAAGASTYTLKLQTESSFSSPAAWTGNCTNANTEDFSFNG